MTGPADNWTNDEWTIHSLNIHGVMFERWCEEQIRASPGWAMTARQHPVAYPPSSAASPSRQSVLDLRADTSGPFKITAIIECKKANPDFVRWVLFDRPADSTLALPIVCRVQTPGERPRHSSVPMPSSVP